MNVRYFLLWRLHFIRQFYVESSAPYNERIRKIESEDPPFVAQHDEGEEPAYLANWMEADESLQVLAYSCISMLAAALHLYFETWVNMSGSPVSDETKKTVFKKDGWLVGYQAHFLQKYKIDFSQSSANLELLKEVILARNVIEHPPSISNMRTQLSAADLKGLKHPFFVDKDEVTLLRSTPEIEFAWLAPPTLHVTGTQLVQAISEVECLVNWFEPKIQEIWAAKAKLNGSSS